MRFAVAKALKEQLNKGADAIAGALHAANVLTKDIALALRDGAGETATTIAKAFKEHLLEPAGRIAEDLQEIGTDVNEIAKALKEGAGEGLML